ncbi:MAG: MarR family winged helix-turn-helix transcriptional regulator [Eubacteriaceae bacterium]|jgi:DNA-binding MarR family transcriptional regulator|nr:MarR family winged helix-turn-helix transcriptional regulator [Eubacteriaceae bacterium]
MSRKRSELFEKMIDKINESYDLMSEYDSLPHNYGGEEYLYQSESQIIHVVGEHPGITARELSDLIRKTPSFCSQNIRKLKKKDCIAQIRNEQNAREYFLELTEKGRGIYRDHKKFEDACLMRTLENLQAFSDEDIGKFIEMQEKINASFREDVAESKKNGRKW